MASFSTCPSYKVSPCVILQTLPSNTVFSNKLASLPSAHDWALNIWHPCDELTLWLTHTYICMLAHHKHRPLILNVVLMCSTITRQMFYHHGASLTKQHNVGFIASQPRHIHYFCSRVCHCVLPLIVLKAVSLVQRIALIICNLTISSLRV